MTRQGTNTGNLFVPLMPKGVEHILKIVKLGANNRLFVPLMPKGVEHMPRSSLAGVAGNLFVPLMPKGVEHEELVDERREVCLVCLFR